MKHSDAFKIAQGMVEILRPACTRIEIAGSVRRGKPDVHDIEIVAIPDLTPVPAPRPVFGQPVPDWHKTQLDKLLFEVCLEGWLRPEKKGEKYKQYQIATRYFQVVSEAAIMLDLFLVTPPATWGVQFTIRTGPADFSHWIVTRRGYGGAMHNDCRVQDGAVWEGAAPNETKNLIGFEEEKEFLSWLGLGWIEPGLREAKWRR